MAIKHLSTMRQVFKKLTICRKELPVTTCKAFVSCDYCIYFHVFPQTIQHLRATIYLKKKGKGAHKWTRNSATGGVKDVCFPKHLSCATTTPRGIYFANFSAPHAQTVNMDWQSE